jgi:hypothetical protein
MVSALGSEKANASFVLGTRLLGPTGVDMQTGEPERDHRRPSEALAMFRVLSQCGEETLRSTSCTDGVSQHESWIPANRAQWRPNILACD